MRWNGVKYTTGGTYLYNYSNVNGCASTDTLHLTVNYATIAYINKTTCVSYSWHGTIYTKSGAYTFDTVNAKNCDSLTTLNLTINQPTTSTINKTACLNYYWHGTTYTTSGAYTYDTVNANGCDSLTTLILKIGLPAVTDTLYLSDCNSVVYKGKTYTTSIIVYDTVRSYQGCDSIYNVVNIKIVNLFVSGNVYHPKGFHINYLQPATVNLSGANSESNLFNQNYQLNCLTYNNAGTIKLYKNNDLNKTNGVTSLDVALVQSHILQKNLLNSPYKIIAADVSNDGRVTALDIVYLKRLILGVDTAFPGNRLWAFVDSSYKFADTTNPFPYKDSISYTGLVSNKTNQTFIGMKLGDVNWDWSSGIAKIATNSLNNIEFLYPTINLKSPDHFIRIPVKVKNFKDMLGIQFTISFNSSVLQWQGIDNNILNIETGTNHAKEGSVSFIWVDPNNTIKTLEDGSIIMELVFERLNDCIDEQIDLNSTITSIAAYDKDYYLHGITMNSSLINVTDLVKDIWTVAPNPSTNGIIHVQMQLKNSKSLLFRLTDINGRVMMTKQSEGIKGNNILTLNPLSQLPSGVYYLQAIGLEGDNVKKVIVGN